jgi:hypothetical protein
MRLMRVAILLLLAAPLLLAACGPASPPGSPAPVSAAPPEPVPEPPPDEEAEAIAPEAPADAGPPVSPPPWAGPPLAAADVPRVFRDEHRKAANRETCPLLVPTEVEAGARPRRASFHGGWAVAYDKKGAPGSRPSGEPCASCGRSAFGVAGTGSEKGGGPEWPGNIVWSDGSRAGYGLEGGQGPRMLAFVERADAGCLYNVWSALGEEHLVALIESLRSVEQADQAPAP